MSVIRIGIDLPWLGSTWPVGASISPSILLALSDLSSSPLLPSHTIEFAWLDSRCDATAGSDVTAEFLAGYDVDVLIGSACSAVALELGDAMTEAAAAGSPFKAIPHISYGAAAPELGDKTSFPHFSRMVADYSGYAAALLALSEKLGWGSIAVLHNSDSLYAETAAVLESAFAGSATSAALHPFSSSSAASSFLSGEGAGADAVVLLGYCPDVVDWLGLADSLGLRASSRPFLHADVTQACLNVAAPDAPVDLAGTWGMKSPAPDPDSPLMVRLTNLAAAAALPPAFDFGNFMSFPYGTIDPGDAAAAFEASMAEETRSYATSEPDSTYAPYLYDAIMLYATAMDRLMSDMGHDFFAEGETIPLNMANM
jgi:ABC-type branched-subunit amino acid transport system substrate-binding protein